MVVYSRLFFRLGLFLSKQRMERHGQQSRGASRIGNLVLLSVAVSACGHPDRSRDHQVLSEDQHVQTGMSEQTRFTSSVHQPYRELGMNSGAVDQEGKPIRIPCRTCHDWIVPSEAYLMATQLKAFHQGVKLVHGDLTCRACHHPPDFQRFHLATTRIVSYEEVMDLCAQCHGRQRNDYDHGAHGGMTGYWDLNAGPRSRNHCLDCHNAHKPAIPQMLPAPRPRYRFLDRGTSDD